MTETQGGGRRLLNATAVMASGTMVSRILGLVRAMLIAFILGNITRRVEVFTFAMTVPNSLYMLLAGGTLNNVLVPQIVRAVIHDDDGGKAFVDRIMTGFLMILGFVTVVLTIATPVVMAVYAPGLNAPGLEAQWRSLLLMGYVTMPQLFFYGVFFLIGQVLNAKEKFGPMMWAPILNNVVSISVFSIYLAVWGTSTAAGEPFTDAQVWLLGVGSTVGIAVQTLVLLPFLKAAGFTYRPRFDLKGTGLGRTFHVAKWMVGYVALTSLAQVVVSQLASTASGAAGGGAGINAYQNAYLIWILPHSLLTVSLATAMLPMASKYALAGDRAGVAAETTRALRLACTFLLPAAFGLAVLADPITDLVFGNGNGAQDYHFVSWALLAFAIGLVPYTIQYLYLRAFYALDNTRTPFLMQIWISGANALLAIAFVSALANPGTVAARLALSYSVAYFLGVFITHRALKKQLPELDGRDTWRHLSRLVVAAVPAAAIAWVITWWFGRYPGRLLLLLGLALAGVAAVLAFFFAAKRLGIPEATSLMSILRRRPRATESDAVESIIEVSDPEDDHRAPELNPDPDGTGVFIPVAPTAGPPAEVLDFPDPPTTSTSASPAGDGRVLGRRYRLEEELAVRDRTQTWRAHDITLGRAVLVHLLAAGDPRTPEVLRLARDASLATDSRFLRVLDVVEDEPGAGSYLVYEYAAGQTLEKVLRGGALTGVETAWVVREVADGLIGLHAQGLYHRHLSPATLLITASGNVKVLGFGVNEASQATESLNGEAADVRALGQLLYACLVARWPGGEEFGLPAVPVVDGRWVLPSQLRSGVAPAVEQIVDRILSPAPRARATRLTTAQDTTMALSLVLGPMSASHDLRARLHPSIDPDEAPPAPVSTVAPPVPTPAASRFTASASLDPESPQEATQPFVEVALSHGDSFTPVPPPAAAKPALTGAGPDAGPVARSGMSRRPVLIGSLALVLAVGIIAAVVLSMRPAATPAAIPGTLQIAKVDDFDPKTDGGSGAENSGQAKLAVDGDPSTAWRTERYRKLAALGGLKPGVGLVVDLGSVRLPTRVEVLLSGEPTTVELRVPTEPGKPDEDAPTKSANQWTRVAGAADAAGKVTLDLPEGRRTRYLLVYLTSLAPLGDGYFRSGIAEVSVVGT